MTGHLWTICLNDRNKQRSVLNVIAEHDSHLQPHPSKLQVRSCNQTLKTFPELKIPPPTSTTPNVLQLQPNTPGPPDRPLQRWAQEAAGGGETCAGCEGVSRGRWRNKNRSGCLTVMEKQDQSSIYWSNLGPQGMKVWTGPDTLESAALVTNNCHTHTHTHCGWTVTQQKRAAAGHICAFVSPLPTNSSSITWEQAWSPVSNCSHCLPDCRRSERWDKTHSLHDQLQSSIHHQHLSRNIGRLQQEEDSLGYLLWLTKPPQWDGAHPVPLLQPRSHVSADETWTQKRVRTRKRL